MNKSYKSVWNETTGTYVAASEASKSKGKASRNQKTLVAALLAAGIGFGTAVKSEAATTPNSFAAGVLGTNTSNSACISSADGATVTTNDDCSAATQQAGIVSFNSSGTAGSYFTVTDPNTAHIGAGGVDQMQITKNGVFVLNGLDMGSNKITALAAGTVSTDAANFGQLTGAAQSIASALGGGATVDASGRVTTPSYTIGGVTYSDVGSALGGLQTSINGVSSSNKFIATFNGGGTAASVWAGNASSLAVGSGAVSSGSNASALGSGASATAASTTAVGARALASAANATVLGYTATGSAVNTAVFGFDATAAATSSTVIGNHGSVGSSGTSSTALGYSASVNVSNSVALGANSLATRANTVSVGAFGSERQIVNVTAGTQKTDAVNFAQIQAAGLTVDSSGNATNSFVAYDDTTQGKVTLGGASGTTLSNVAAATQGTDAVNYAQLQAAGLKTDASGNATNSFVAYDDATAGKVTLGGASGTTITNLKAGAVSASSMDAVNGSQLYTTNQNVAQNTAAIAQNTGDISTNAGNIAQNTSDISANTSNIAQNTSDIGTLNTQVGTLNSQMSDAVKYDSSAHDTVTLAGASGTTLTNLKAGAVSASSTDAVNGSQLFATNANVSQNTAAITQNTSDIAQNASDVAQNTTDIAKNAGDITNIDSRVSTVEGSVTNITNQINSGELGLVQQDQTSRNLTVGAATDGTQISVAGTAGNRVVTGVAAGSLTASSNDAVNGSQLSTTNQNVAQNAAAIAQNTSDIAENASAITTLNSTVNNINSGSIGLVQQDATSHEITVANATAGTTVDFTGTAGARQLKGVASGIADTDAVNVAQLKAAGLSTDTNGNVTNAFVAYDDNTKDTLTLGGGVAGTSITNLRAGALSASSTDAVNGSQLYMTNQNVAQNTAAITQNASDIAQNTSDITKNAGDITNIDSRVTNVEGSMTNITNQINSGELGLVQQDQTSRDLTVAKSTDGTRVDFAGAAGARELLGVAAGTTPGSAVNLGQLSPVVAALGGGAQVNADGSIISPTYHMQGGTQTTVGGALDALDTNLSSLTAQINTGSIGMVTQDSTSRDLRVGASTDGLRVSMSGTAGNRVVTGVAAGAVNASSSDAVNGSQLYANAGSTASALGGGSVVNADGTISAPTYSVGGTTVNNVGAAISNIDGRVNQNTSDIASLQTTVGTMSGSVANAVQYDSAAHDKVTLGGVDSAKVKLTNLQDAELSATSTDAVTGAQLWNTNQQISDLNQTVQNYQTTSTSGMSIDNGGAPAAAATGSGSMAMGGGSQASGDNSMAMGSGSNASGSGSMAMGAGAQASGDNAVALGAGSVADQANTVSVGSAGNERRITNVADGNAPTDAVNMRQFQSGLGSVARNAYSGVAAATALTMIPEVDPGKTLAVGVAGGSYKGYQAAAIGASARINANLKVKVGAGISAADTTYGVGASYQW